MLTTILRPQPGFHNFPPLILAPRQWPKSAPVRPARRGTSASVHGGLSQPQHAAPAPSGPEVAASPSSGSLPCVLTQAALRVVHP